LPERKVTAIKAVHFTTNAVMMTPHPEDGGCAKPVL
jgi:hypothetical protein